MVALAENVVRDVVPGSRHGSDCTERRRRCYLLDRHHWAPPGMAAVGEITGRLSGKVVSR